MSFIVTKEGLITNINQERGNFDMNFCPAYINSLQQIICNFGKLTPAFMNGEKVNVRYSIDVDMQEEWMKEMFKE